MAGARALLRDEPRRAARAATTAVPAPTAEPPATTAALALPAVSAAARVISKPLAAMRPPIVTSPPLDAGRSAPVLPSFQQLADAWATEKDDKEWTSNVTNDVYAMLNPEDTPANLVHEVRCRESLCRLTFGSEGIDALGHLGEGLQHDGYPFRYQLADVDGASAVTVFIMRDEALRALDSAPTP